MTAEPSSATMGLVELPRERLSTSSRRQSSFRLQTLRAPFQQLPPALPWRAPCSASLRSTKCTKSFLFSNSDGHALLEFRGARHGNHLGFRDSTQNFVVRSVGYANFHFSLLQPALIDNEYVMRAALSPNCRAGSCQRIFTLRGTDARIHIRVRQQPGLFIGYRAQYLTHISRAARHDSLWELLDLAGPCPIGQSFPRNFDVLSFF